MSTWGDLNADQLRETADEHLDQAATVANIAESDIVTVLAHGFHALVCELRACHADFGKTV